MIAVRLLLLAEIENQLGEFGCERQDAPTDMEEVTYWKTPWDHYFFVPALGPDLACPDFKLGAIINEIKLTRPELN